MEKRQLYAVLVWFAAAAFLVVPAFSVFANGSHESGGGQITLNWPSIWVGQDSKAKEMAILVSEFNKDHAGKIQVNVEPNPNYDGYRNKINASIAAGQVPDVFIFNPDPTEFQYYNSNVLLDFTHELQGTSWGKEFAPGTLEEATRDGRIKSIPYEIGVTPIWYNKALFEKAGITSFPTTISEFWADCAKLKAAGITPTAQMTGGTNAWTSNLWYSQILLMLGGPNLYKNNPPFSDNIYVEAAQMLQRMYNDYTTKDAVGADAAVAGGHFKTGQVAMFLNGPWYIGQVKQQAPQVYKDSAVAPFPTIPGGHPGGEIVFALSNLAAANTQSPARQAAVITFMKWLTKPVNVRALSESAGSMFAVKYPPDPANTDPLQAKFIESMNNAKFTAVDLTRAIPAQVTAQLGQGFGAMALGKMTPEQFVAFMRQQLKQAQQ